MSADFQGKICGSAVADLAPGDRRLAALYTRVHEDGIFPAADLFTIRDLVTVSGCRDAPLQFLLAALFAALAEGSLCVRVAALAERLAPLLGDEAASAAAEVAAWLKQPHPGLVGSAGMFVPVILDDVAGRVFFQRTHAHGRRLAAALLGFLAVNGIVLPGAVKQAAELAPILRAVLEENPLRKRGAPLAFGDGQRRALGLALLKNFVVVSGGPGTGKTSIVAALVRCLARAGVDPGRIKLCAPTGKAARRLTDSIAAQLAGVDADPREEALRGLAATTLHRLLRYSPNLGRFLHHRLHPVPADVVIIDEVSMIDVVMMAKCLEALAPGTRLVFLGDRHQLPSVEAGAVLADLVPPERDFPLTAATRETIIGLCPGITLPAAAAAATAGDAGADRVVVLAECYRSAKELQKIANGVNAGEAGILDDLPVVEIGMAVDGVRVAWPASSGCACLAPPETADARLRVAHFGTVLAAWADRVYLATGYAGLVRAAEAVVARDEAARRDAFAGLFRALDEARVLTLLREGPFGAGGVNRALAGLLGPVIDPGSGQAEAFSGLPVMITANDYGKDLFNGEVGVLVRDHGGGLRAVFARGDAYVDWPLDTLGAWEPGFALTVHKSQGSEYGEVLLVLPDEGDAGAARGARLLTREILYTGITRAQHRVLVYGTRAQVAAAISRRVLRESGLDLWGAPPA